MRSHAQPVSRRWFIGAGAAIACAGPPPCAQAQTASDGFRLLHARTLGFSAHEPILDVIRAFIEDDLAATKADRGTPA